MVCHLPFAIRHLHICIFATLPRYAIILVINRLAHRGYDDGDLVLE
jgi:hypothetical protein